MNCTVYFLPRWNTLSFFFIKYGTKRDVVDAIGLIGWSGGGGEGDATHFFCRPRRRRVPVINMHSDRFAIHTRSLTHSSTRDGRQLIKGIPIRFVETCHGGTLAVDWSIGRYGEEGWKCSQRSGVDSKNIISDAKYCFLCVEKLTATWGWGMVRGTLWSYDSYRRSTRAKGFYLKRTWIARTAVMVLDFWAKSAWDRVRRLLVLGFV